MASTDYYTQPTGNETNGFYNLFGYINRVSGGIFWPIMLLVLWIITFLAIKQYSTSRAWTFASFFCAILSIPLAVLDYIAPVYMYMCIFLTIVGFVWLKLEDQ